MADKKSRTAFFPGNPAVFPPMERPVAFRPRLTPGLAFFLSNNYIAGAINMSRHFLK
jgi:hypothetical protein